MRLLCETVHSFGQRKPDRGLFLHGLRATDEWRIYRSGFCLAARRPAPSGPSNGLAGFREGTSMAENLTEHLAGKECTGFDPRPHYFADGDFVTYFASE